MNAAEQLEALKIQIGARPGQILLFVDLSAVEQPSDVLKRLTTLGYEPQLRYLELKTGLHVIAILKDEQLDPTQSIDTHPLLDEWESLTEQIHPEAIRLWHGLPSSSAA